MSAYVAGDESAFRELFARYTPILLGLLRRHIPRSEDAQDLVQQTFLQFHRARLDFKAGCLVRPWLFTIALNVRRESARRRGRRRESELGVDPPAPEVLAPDPEDAARLRAGLRALPEQQREVIELHWFQGVGFAEIASIVGASLSAVKVRAHRGYERLRETLGRAPGSASGRARAGED